MNSLTKFLGMPLGMLILFASGCYELPPIDGNPNDPLSTNYVPVPPLGVYGYATSTTSIMVVWHDRSMGEGGFEIERREDQSSFGTIGRVGTDRYYFLDSSRVLTQGHLYTYRVRSFAGARFSEYSNEASARLYP